MMARLALASTEDVVKTWDVPRRCHIHTEMLLDVPSFFTPTDCTLAAFVVWVALVALFSVDSAAFWCDVRSLTPNIALHGLENGRLHPSRPVALGRFLRQEVQIIGCLGGQAHGNDGFSIRHGSATL